MSGERCHHPDRLSGWVRQALKEMKISLPSSPLHSPLRGRIMKHEIPDEPASPLAPCASRKGRATRAACLALPEGRPGGRPGGAVQSGSAARPCSSRLRPRDDRTRSQGRSGYPVATLIVLGSQELEASVRVLYLNVRNGRLSFRFQLNAAIQPIADNFDTTFISVANRRCCR